MDGAQEGSRLLPLSKRKNVKHLCLCSHQFSDRIQRYSDVPYWEHIHRMDYTSSQVFASPRDINFFPQDPGFCVSILPFERTYQVPPRLNSTTLLVPSTINPCSAWCILSCKSPRVPHPWISTSCCTIGSPRSTSAIT